MGRRNKNKPLYENVVITDVGAEGRSIARHDGLVLFTSHVIPGDVVDLQVIKKKKKFQEAKVVRIRQFSPDRIEAFCGHFEVCGGCKWQFLPYEKQLFYKQKQVSDQFRRIGKFEIPEISPVIGSANTVFYRNKLEFTFSSSRWLTSEEINAGEEVAERRALGFHIPGMFDKIINIGKCWLQPEPSNEIRNFIYEFSRENNLVFFDTRALSGFLRTLIIRTSSAGEVMAIITFFSDDEENRIKLLEAVKRQFPQITSLLYVINGKGNDTIIDQEVRLYSGNEFIWEEMEGLKFKVGPKSFYQTNSKQAYELYKVVREFAAFQGDETVYDLYTGTGTIANFIARSVKKVVGIEYVPEAVGDARENAAINGNSNTLFFSGDIQKVLNDGFFAENGRPEIIITDPPRAGMHPGVIESILKAVPEKIIYVSCNPATQARDIALMDELYLVKKIQPVDMFPHTHHVENVVLLERKQD